MGRSNKRAGKKPGSGSKEANIIALSGLIY
jgi:hypothetical protein